MIGARLLPRAAGLSPGGPLPSEARGSGLGARGFPQHPPQYEAIVPAYNEEVSVAEVVATILASGRFSRVLVVDDGSSDRTAIRAREAGADVLSKTNEGKAAAMLDGLMHTTSDPVAFFDADLRGFQPWHAQRLAHLADLGYDMVCGLRDYGAVKNYLSLYAPLITGERFVRRALFAAVEDSCIKGYDIESGLNHACKVLQARCVVTPLRGLGIRGKVEKGGWWKGMAGHYKMFNRIATSSNNLRDCGACQPAAGRQPLRP